VSLGVHKMGAEEVRLTDMPRLLLVEHFNQKHIFLQQVVFLIFSVILRRVFRVKNEFTFYVLFCRSSSLSLMNHGSGLLNLTF
jgi:hypothetical protein